MALSSNEGLVKMYKDVKQALLLFMWIHWDLSHSENHFYDSQLEAGRHIANLTVLCSQ